jgi:uncharacterized protein (DUF1800 family)
VTTDTAGRRDRPFTTPPVGQVRDPGPGVASPPVAGGRLGGTSGYRRDPAWRTGQVHHLLRRATFGITPALVAEVTYENRWDWLAAQLDPASVADDACADVLSRLPALTMTPPQVRAAVAAEQLDSWEPMFALGRAAVARATWSRRQLFEVMVDLWSNHLNVTCPSSEVWDNRCDFDRTVVRTHALGRYADLLLAATLHPAMLSYLNNTSSTKDAPNENLGRELLELHSVGVEAGYTESDVLASARILTGHSIDWDSGLYVYRPADHWTGQVRVLGFSRANTTAGGGPTLVADYVAYLARHPATARRVATRLAVRFVADVPPPQLVERLAATYLTHDTAIVPVLWELFRSAEFAESLDAKTRRPFEALVAVLRTLDLRPALPGGAEDPLGTQALSDLFWMLGDLGQQPLAWPLPNGYPDVASAWQSAGGTLARWNATMSVVGGWWPTTLTRDPVSTLLPATLPATYGDLVGALWQRLHFRTIRSSDRDALCRFLGGTVATALSTSSDVLDDWLLVPLVSLVLDAPAVMSR